jgi:hypothetical protein
VSVLLPNPHVLPVVAPKISAPLKLHKSAVFGLPAELTHLKSAALTLLVSAIALAH